MFKVKIKVNGKEKILSSDCFSVNLFSGNKYVIRLYDDKGNIYTCIQCIDSNKDYHFDLSSELLIINSPEQLNYRLINDLIENA